ncbi:60S ribosomal protein L13a-1-like isoform X9 [Quercus robur]|uniref:60S ribosomal protein L13a-1-like isoform X9 n=1 Tax=Quercus robur TaxID=38942 RepID=UPI0021617F85|nr:60S ribosomal protein L13a-1-like isoform X9 [Quercus robur]
MEAQAGHKYCLLGKLSSEVGWNHYDTIKVKLSSFEEMKERLSQFEEMQQRMARMLQQMQQITSQCSQDVPPILQSPAPQKSSAASHQPSSL